MKHLPKTTTTSRLLELLGKMQEELQLPWKVDTGWYVRYINPGNDCDVCPLAALANWIEGKGEWTLRWAESEAFKYVDTELALPIQEAADCTDHELRQELLHVLGVDK